MMHTSLLVMNRVRKEFAIFISLIWSLPRKDLTTVKILKFGTPQTIAIIVLEIETFDVTLY